MGRKTKLQSQDRRQAIIEAITPLVAAAGLEGVTTKAMAAAAGVSEALLYKHFPSKDDIYRAIQQSCVEHATADVELFHTMPDSTECLVMIVWHMMRSIVCTEAELEPLDGKPRASKPMTRLLMRSLLASGDFGRSYLNETAETWFVKVKTCALKGGQSAG
ncbi:MAG: TetR/AcrR family transcriptional regulator, partial [Myxococcota bacterium]